MALYYVNKVAQINGTHEVHQSGCEYLPNIKNLYYLGEFSDWVEAVLEAEKYFLKVSGCGYCCKVNNTSIG